MSRLRRRRQNGFTLVEILVVVAILGVITALAVPAYQHVRVKLIRNRMLHHMNMIANDQMLYYRDNSTFYGESSFSFGAFSYVWAYYRWTEPIELKGQGITLDPGKKQYTFYVYWTSFMPEPYIYAWAYNWEGNDLDGDPYMDYWIKVGSGPALVLYDDTDNSSHWENFP
jgi:prepilin-type N-terminal cleavage/methylation domain-containing protein